MKRLIYITFILASYLMSAQSDISELEYYFNTDPGVGNGTSIAIDPNVELLDQNFNIPTAGLPSGNHKLFVRAVKDDGSVGYYYSQSFSIRNANATFNSANIDGFEYYFNTDPGIGNGTQLSVTEAEDVNQSFNISTTSLGAGNHKLFIRTINSDGTYSTYDNVTFSIMHAPAVFNTSNITAAEYYLNTDPGVGNAVNIAISNGELLNENLAFITNTLTQGSYRAFLRVKNADDVWSMYDRVSFSVVPLADINTADINSIEYFFDNDPGVGMGSQINLTDTEIVNQNLAIPTTGLTTGSHRLFVRVGNTNGTYSLYTHTVIAVKTPAFFNNASIVAAEYFIDTDPGLGNGTQIAASGDGIDENLIISTSGSMAQGDHYVYIRVQNTDGSWSLYERAHFEVSSTLGLETETLNEISMFPNPTHDNIHLKLPESVILETVQLIDLNGKVVFYTQEQLHKIDLSKLSNGVYLLQLKTNVGEISKRIIKQ
ncbi:T9SS type A sorting domain-containing protein [Psychroserpens sp. S379A]|uniref:T9SS type A sorting domain-containing protein n=1 Tax=Psychroserpens sp. S379A TaxID=3415137 RepID=UPI003C7C15DD